MTAAPKTSLVSSIEKAAAQAGLTLASVTQGSDFHGEPTTVFELGLADSSNRSLKLELSHDFDFDKPTLLPEITAHLAAEAKRLRNPRPECYVTLGGIPVAFGKFQWPFHRSTSGADTYIVHGELDLADGKNSGLHAKVAASVTVTFAEIVPAMEQPYAESFVYNAIRKTVDFGQLEFLKSGNRQPVPVTTRFYSRWQKKFLFTETDDKARLEYLLSKVYWLSGVLGASKPVWIADPKDAQYLNTTEKDLLRMANDEAGEGLMTVDGEFAAATPALMARASEFQARLDAALSFIKPQFNEAMRSGQANM
ncbi:hypothetical protein [Occallatibacter riparius]|uniref:Uncharacterized protein n=1 Tax=Occallatibacter riparius TaxID=1002689 RepID=A0A9J7BWX3_9BACT|nr:hypothetical protein [Occallatibacter riparius]UWZ85382.1 hypothetical protein MOP44_05435 [Occallatibacter riparius]